MNKILLAMLVSIGVMVATAPAIARQGGDDIVDHARQGRGADDPAGHVSGRDRTRGRGADDPAGHVRQGRGADDPAGHVSGRDRASRF